MAPTVSAAWNAECSLLLWASVDSVFDVSELECKPQLNKLTLVTWEREDSLAQNSSSHCLHSLSLSEANGSVSVQPRAPTNDSHFNHPACFAYLMDQIFSKIVKREEGGQHSKIRTVERLSLRSFESLTRIIADYFSVLMDYLTYGLSSFIPSSTYTMSSSSSCPLSLDWHTAHCMKSCVLSHLKALLVSHTRTMLSWNQTALNMELGDM